MCEYVNVLKVTAFGFTFELLNDRCFFVDKYEIYLNDVFYQTSNQNVVSLFSLKPNTDYSVKIKRKKFECDFTVKTSNPTHVINVKDYNAKGDGVTCDTSAINLAIYTAPQGSVVYFPKGEYLVDQILLKSFMDIYLEKGAVIRQSYSREKLGILKGYQKKYDHSDAEINASWEGNPLDCYCSLIYAKNVYDVNIYGEGIIDGNGDVGGFWENPKVKNVAFRPKNIFLVDCQYINIIGITSRNSASWNIHPFLCSDIKLIDLKVESIEESPNTDGINPESCNGVDIVGCHFSVGDDCIAIKAGKYFMTTLRHNDKYTNELKTKDITIRNCFMEKGHGAVVIGSEMSCGVYNVNVSQCLLKDTDRGLRIKTRRGRGKSAIADGITFDNVKMEGVRHCFVINMYYNCDPDGKSLYVRDKNYREPDEFTPAIKNITVSNIMAKDTLGSAVFIYGLPESKVEGVKIINSYFSFADETRRVCECPAMMNDFEVKEDIYVFVENVVDYSTNGLVVDKTQESIKNNKKRKKQKDKLKLKKIIKRANNRNKWRHRLWALNKIKGIDCPERAEIVTRLALHDRVYKVKEKAFHIAQKLKLTVDGEPITLTKKDIGYDADDFTRAFVKAKNEIGMRKFDLWPFKQALMKVNPEMYNVMRYEKGDYFNNWVRNVYLCLPKRDYTFTLFQQPDEYEDENEEE